jgi:hypothetical protein
VLIPFGEEHDLLYRNIDRPAIEAAGLTPLRGDEINRPGEVTTQVCDAIATASVILADLSASNPNVCYELGLAIASAHASQASCPHRRGDRLPFNIGSLRVIIRDDPSVNLGIRKAISAALGSPNSSVPTFLATPAFSKATASLGISGRCSPVEAAYEEIKGWVDFANRRILLLTIFNRTGRSRQSLTKNACLTWRRS